MAQLDPNRYVRLSSGFYYGRDDGTFYDKTLSQLVVVVHDTIVMRLGTTAGAVGKVLCGDGSSLVAASLSDDAAISAAGALRLKNDASYEIAIPSTSGIDTDALGGG